LIHDPDRAEKIKELLFLPLFRCCKLGSRQYVAAKVGYTATEFMKREVLPLLPSAANVKIEVQWVKSQSDPVLTGDGRLILCLRETNDQTRNILAATQAALPKIVCPTIRSCVSREFEDAVDLAIMQKLTSALGKHAKPVFYRYFLTPSTEENQALQTLFAQLVQLDAHGTFVPIFLEELDAFGERLYAAGDTSDQSDEIYHFLNFLLAEARREEHQAIPLDYFSKGFSVGIIILAVSYKMQREGVTPYVNRIDQNIRKGCDSIYVIAYQKASRFLDKLLEVIDADNRFSLAKVATPRVHNPVTHRQEQWKIAQLRRSPLFSDADFAGRVAANSLTVGGEVEGQVLDVSETQTFVDVLGLNAVIQRAECSWKKVHNCHDVLTNGERREFLVVEIDEAKGQLLLSLRFPAEDPWQTSYVPLPGETVQAKAQHCDGSRYYCYLESGLEVLLPRHEISWMDSVPPDSNDLIGQELSLVITEKDDDHHVLTGSMRQQEDDPWPLIQKRLPKGTKLRGSVVEVTSNFVRVSLPDGLHGIVPASCLQNAGYELADFTKTVVVGQGLDVVVTKVFLSKQRIRLDLVRNIEGS
jgi:predicted RNA-binding protein with RPS1 domain